MKAQQGFPSSGENHQENGAEASRELDQRQTNQVQRRLNEAQFPVYAGEGLAARTVMLEGMTYKFTKLEKDGTFEVRKEG